MQNYLKIKYGIISLVFVFGSFDAFSQKTELELIAGSNFSTLTSSPDNYSSKAGFTAGIGRYKFIGANVSIGIRLLYQRQAVHGVFPFVDGSVQGEVEMTTCFDKLTMPVVGRYTYGTTVKFSGEFGGFLSYQYNESLKDLPDYVSSNPSYVELVQASKQYTPVDAGVSLGASMQVPMNSRLSFKLLVFDNIGLVNISQIKFNQYQGYKTNSLNFVGALVFKVD